MISPRKSIPQIKTNNNYINKFPVHVGACLNIKTYSLTYYRPYFKYFTHLYYVMFQLKSTFPFFMISIYFV